MEEMLMPCPLDICDGSGVVPGVEPWDAERKCPCRDEGDHDPELADNAAL